MTLQDYKNEALYKDMAAKPRAKGVETITTFNRDIYLYNRDSAHRNVQTTTVATYEDHRKAVETAVNMFRKTSSHDIALLIMNHRAFHNYRELALKSRDFYSDYSYLVTKIGMLFNPNTGTIKGKNPYNKLAEFTSPTLVQINHITGSVSPVNVPTDVSTLNEWAIKLTAVANESTTYVVAGMKLGM